LGKRAFDLLLAVLGMVFLLPIFLTVAIAVRLSGPGPVLLRQRRVGAHGSVFSMLKFRTMIDGAEADGRPFWCCENDERITAVGRVLRAHHLDELPQLWNVLVGQMSLVGPRPERPEIDEALAIEIPQWRCRNEVRPGITGLAQVRQGYVASVEGSRVKLTHDLHYLAHCSLRFDLAIMRETFGLRPRRQRLMQASPEATRPTARPSGEDKSVTAQVLMLTGARLVAATLSAVTALILARSLTKSDYGQLALLTGVVTLFVVITDGGLTSSLARYLSGWQVGRRIFLQVIALRGGLTGLAALGVLAYGAAAGEQEFRTASVLAAILLLANSITSVAHGILPTMRRVGTAACLTVLQPAVELAGIATAASSGLSTATALAAMAVAAGTSALIGSMVLLTSPMPVRETTTVLEVCRYALPLFGVFVCVSVFGVIDLLLIGFFHDASTVAPYALSWKLVIFLHLPALAIATVIAPRLAQDRKQAAELFGRWIQRTAVVNAGVLAVVAALATEIMGLIDDQYRDDGAVLLALVAYAAVLGLAPLLSMACNFLGGARARLPVAAAAVVTNIALDLVLIPSWGPYGAALSSTLAYLVYVVGHARIAGRLLEASLWPGGARVAVRVAFGAGAAFLVARITADWLSSSGLLVAAALASVSALCAYVTVAGTGVLR
jgi:lipopolysaccharide/colanic/teichoic acid biosynthesis glycosyltransferase/O-antigen/teichoic acid export membrane protein